MFDGGSSVHGVAHRQLRRSWQPSGRPPVVFLVSKYVAFEFVAEPEEREANEDETDGDCGGEEGDAGPAAWGCVGVDEPVRVPVGRLSVDEGVDEVRDGIDEPKPDVLGAEP